MTNRRLTNWTVTAAWVLAAMAASILVSAQPTGVDGSGQLFVLSDRCMACHNGLVAPDGEDVSIGTLWQSSMMAHASRDPYWLAAVRRESLDHPSARTAIEDECATCHMPMSHFTANQSGGDAAVFDHIPAAGVETPMAKLAVAGVSCTLCHQITGEGLGDRSSYVGGFVIDSTTPLGSRKIFGPFDVDRGRETVMRSASRFVPTPGDHIRSSELCATCHTLYTHALDDDGEVIGELPEQVPYLEWRHSAYRGVRTCQSCHMPVVNGEIPITGVLGQPRSGFSRHAFRGGNFLMPRIFNRFRDELTPQAPPEGLNAASRSTVEHLQTSAARIVVQEPRIDDRLLRFEVEVSNLAGHKLPTAYPSRRAWVALEVSDRNGQPVFSSGALRPDGAIEGNDNDADPMRFEPHYEEISSGEQVQIYEAIMADRKGRVTTGLLSAVRFVKDNRVLPVGFDILSAPEDIAVQGAAAEDADFAGGSDRIRFSVPLGETAGPFRIQAELWYQPVAFRWAHNLSEFDSEETERFVTYFDALSDSSAVVLARADATLE